MAKLYFKFGAMGCSKSASALITKFNYEERHMKVMLAKPSTDSRELGVIHSRIGLEAPCACIAPDDNLFDMFTEHFSDCQVVIIDECQFLSPEQVDQLSQIVYELDIPVLCFGLASDFLTHLFPGSKRLFEIAESVTEIKSICECGRKATVNARFDDKGHVLFSGDQICIGGNERYQAMCRRCWLKRKAEQEAAGLFT